MRNATSQAHAEPRAENELVDAATPLLQLIMQLKAGLRAPSNELRPTIAAMFKRFEEQAAKGGYKEHQVQNAKFALTAFVDETALAGGFPLREEWERYPLQLEYFREALAGTKLFERLDELLRQAETEADVVEVYYLCLLLGFKGKYDVFLEDQLPGVINGVGERLRQVGRLRASVLAPNWLANDQPEPPPAAPEVPRWIKLSVAAAGGAVVLIYLLLSFLLVARLNEVQRSLLK